MKTPSKIFPIIMLTFKESIRNRTLQALVCLAIIFSFANIFVTELFSWDLGKVSVSFGLSTMALTGLLLIFFQAIKLLADDFERHSIYLLMARPVTGSQYILGKFLGISLTLFLVMLIIGIGAALSLKFIVWSHPGFNPPDFSWLTFIVATIFLYISQLIILAISFFWFSFAAEPFVAILLTVSSYFIGQNMELLRRVVSQGEKLEVLSIHEAVVFVISWLFPNLSFFDLKVAAAYGLPLELKVVATTALYGISHVALLLLLAIFFFNRKELA